MKKSTVKATCLVNSNMITRLQDAEARVHEVFSTSFRTQIIGIGTGR